MSTRPPRKRNQKPKPSAPRCASQADAPTTSVTPAATSDPTLSADTRGETQPSQLDPELIARIEHILHQIPGYNPWDQKADCWLDHEAALAAINFFADHLRHGEGSARGEPFVLAVWQAAIVGNLFGWKRRDDAGRIVRRYRKALIYIPRGNGKTPLAAGIALCAFFNDGEPGAQCYLAAGAREQAGFLFRNARAMVEQDEDLVAGVKIYAGDQHRSMVLNDDPMAFLKVIPAEAATQHGGIPHLVVLDELHVQENGDLLEVFETGMRKKGRRQPLLVLLTTADYDRPSVCNEVYDKACKVRDNGGNRARAGFDPEFLPVIYEAGKDDDWRDEKTHVKANPNIDVSVSRESLAAAAREAQEIPAKENGFRRLNLNQRTSQDTRIISMSLWRDCAGAFDARALAQRLKGRPCAAGLDLASTEDLASLGLIFPLSEADRPLFGEAFRDINISDGLAILSWSFCPEEKVKKRAAMRVPYDIWQRDGFLVATPGNMIDYDAIDTKFAQLRGDYDIQTAGVDPASGGRMFAALLCRQYGEQFAHEVGQTFDNLSGPFKQLLRLLKKRVLIHGGNPVLDWQAGNLAAHYKGAMPNGAELADHLDRVPIIPSKQKSPDKIDALAAIIIGLARLFENPIAVGGGGPIIELV